MEKYTKSSIEICSPGSFFSCGHRPLSRPNFYSPWRCVVIVIMDIVVDFLGANGGKDDGEIHTSIHHGNLALSALIFLRMKAAEKPTFYRGWHRAAMLVLVIVVADLVVWRGGMDGESSIHPSIN